MISLAVLHRRVRRAVLGRRRLLAAIFAAVAVATALRAMTAPPPATVPVVTAARDMPSGSVLRPGDVRVSAYVPQSVPAGALAERDVVGRTTAAPLRAREPITDARLVHASLLAGYPGMVAVPVRIGDADAVRLLRVGDRIDLVGASPQSPRVEVLASEAAVVALPEQVPGPETSTDGALVVVAVPPETARRVAAGAVSSFFSIVITH